MPRSRWSDWSSEVSSPGVNSRYPPRGIPATDSGPTRTRESLVTSIPALSIMRRTIRFIPSCTTTDSSTPSAVSRTMRNSWGTTRLPSISTPLRMRSMTRSDGFCGVSTRYSLVSPYRGCMTRFATSPSLVKSSSPSVSRSSRPTGNSRGSLGKSSMTVRRSRSSLVVVMNPDGLFITT